ncbi:TonB-dependent siderophore receptor [Imbroritus primus]|uniref:TonB-dependent siderophore receptor n=1 Tax=Imbroritus primus TaxID=3058603 RepID=A0ACD3SM58_9BURK|nr:TonB-dependent siderophore receptor [Burkholderiaceae bacterium PBA]
MSRRNTPRGGAAFKVQPTLFAAAAALVFGAAHAQTAAPAQAAGSQAATTLPEVQVRAPGDTPYQTPRASSPKFTAPLLDTPKTVTVIPQEIIEERGAASLTDILRTVPGVTLGSGEGGTPVGDRPFIRGYEASTDIMIDGMRDVGRFTHEAFNLESVEIVKGPGSAYSGRGATGGSINLVTKTPKAETFAAGSVGVGTDNAFRTTVDGNWAGENAAFRLNAMAHKADVAGRNGPDVERWGIAPSLTLGLNGPTRATLSYYALRSDETPDLGHPFDTINNTGRPVVVNGENFYGSTTRDFRKNEADLATVEIEHSFSQGLKLRNITRYGSTLNQYVMTRPTIHVPTGMVNRDARTRNSVTTSLINQTDLSGSFTTGTIRHSFAAGVEFSREEIKTGTAAAGAIPRVDLQNPDPNGPYTGVTSFGPRNTLANRTKTRALYATDTMHLSDKWDVNVGLRLDDYNVTNGTLTNDSTIFNYQAGVVYKPAPNGSVYLTYSTSSNPSGETLGQSGGADGAAGGGLSAGNANLDPERNRSIELGTKWDVLDEQLSLTAAVFRTEKKNQRAENALGDIELIGKSRATGIELGFSGQVTPQWGVFGGYTYLNPKLLADGAGGNAGKQLKYVAKQSFSLWTTYKITPAFTIGGGAFYMSNRFANDANTLVLPSYWRFDAMASYRFNKHFDVRLNVNNLADKTIYDGSHVGLFANVAPGRSAMLTANWKF